MNLKQINERKAKQEAGIDKKQVLTKKRGKMRNKEDVGMAPPFRFTWLTGELYKLWGLFLIVLSTTTAYGQWNNIHGWAHDFQVVDDSILFVLQPTTDSIYLARSFNSGFEWDTIGISDKEDYHEYSLMFLSSNIGAVVSDSAISVTYDSGKKWSNTSIPGHYALKEIFIQDTSSWYVVGDSLYWDYLFKSTDQGLSWKKVSGIKDPNNDPSYKNSHVYFVDNNIGYFGDVDTVLKTTDGGITWVGDSYLPSLLEIEFIGNKIGYCLSSDSLHKTVDGGNIWKGIKENPQGNSVSELQHISFPDENIGYICGSFSNVIALKTIDGGISWDSLNHPLDSTYKVQFLNADTGFCLKGYMGVFKTENGGNCIPFIDVQVSDFDDELLFEDDTIYIIAKPQGGGPYTYSWATSYLGFTLADTTNDTLLILPGKMGYLKIDLTVTDNNGCSVDLSETIYIKGCSNMKLSNLSDTIKVALGDQVVLNPYGSGGKSPYTYTYSPVTYVTSAYVYTGNITIYANPTSDITYYFTATDDYGCIIEDSVFIDIYNCNLVAEAGLDTVVNLGDSVILGGNPTVSGGTSPYTYLWSPSIGLSDPSVANPLCKPTFLTYYQLKVVDVDGCYAYDYVKVDITDTSTVSCNLTLDISSNLLMNVGDTAYLGGSPTVSGGTAPYQYYWYPSVYLDDDNSANPMCVPQSDVNYYVLVLDANGCYTYDYVFVDVNATVGSSVADVWPGDANLDKVADIYDALNIGIAYGFTGTSRSNASLSWTAQPATDWTTYFNSMVNYKHSDCDGNGMVDIDDGDAILQNYGLTHQKMATGNFVPPNAADPYLYVDIKADSLALNSSISAPIILGEDTQQAYNVYGVAFTINYDKSLVDSASMNISLNNSWLGTSGSELETIYKDFYNDGRIDVAVFRTDQQNRSGNGEIGQLNFVTIDNISGKKTAVLNFSVGGVKMIAADESILGVNTKGDSAIVSDSITSVRSLVELSNLVSLYPNPAQDKIYVNANSLSISQISIYDMLGKSILDSYYQPASILIVKTEGITSGTYFMNIYTTEGQIVKKFSVVE